ncbi:DUF3159 domain-containing protein [Actinomycetospora endophytica]|uniref:DUF3159 domain-containing protein n=1 Tax=Actinomycetospora endophytica TaxID=2291215 RepID=A0ABS8PHJ4_9PSEU|nr:DUF3159 domain-containing protein [Actinomycetospora endophytica]MCD2196841.1 DUF3159 domain-containing protein [Actinomycetospora endophytica]
MGRPVAPRRARPDPPTAPVAGRAGTAPVRDGRVGRHGSDGGSGAEDEADGSAEAAEERAPTLLEQMGGVTGVISSAVPVIVFVVVQAIFHALVASIIAAVVSAVAVAVYRLVRGEKLQPAFSGLFGVAVCAFIAWRTGQAKGFFLLGIWTSLLYGGVFLISMIVRWPLVGTLWHLVNGDGQGWRRSAYLRRGYDIATLAWVVVFGARFVVQRWLYDSAYADTWLGWVRLAMGVPLAVLAAAVTVWAIRRATAEAKAEEEAAQGDAAPA